MIVSVFCDLRYPYFTEVRRTGPLDMLDGPMWGLTPEQDSKAVYRVLLTLLRLPGAFLLDIWWDSHTTEIIPRSIQLEDLANSGWHLLPLIMVRQSIFRQIKLFS